MASIRLFGHYVSMQSLLLAVTEVLLFCASFAFAVQTVTTAGAPAPVGALLEQMLPRALLFAAVMVVSMTAMGLYQSRTGEGVLSLLLRLVVSMGVGVVGLTVAFYLDPAMLFGHDILVISCAMALVLVLLYRLVFERLLDRNALKRRVLVLGAGDKAASLVRELADQPRRTGSRIVGFVPTANEAVGVPAQRLLPAQRGLEQLVREHKVEEIVIAVKERRNNLPLEALLACKIGGVRILDENTFFERETGKVSIERLYPGWLVFSEGYHWGLGTRVIRRLCDLTAAATLLVLSLPLMALTALAIWLESGCSGPIIYRQMRVGEHGRNFEVLKFRSMRVDAEADGQVRWAQPRDSRVTHVGSLIRRMRIDELPQLLNVLRGEMSFVGPRPERPEFVSELSKRIPFYPERHRVKPGLTGWAQLYYPYGASEQDAAEKLQFDLYYLKNQSVLLDMLILMQTFEVVLFGRGAR